MSCSHAPAVRRFQAFGNLNCAKFQSSCPRLRFKNAPSQSFWNSPSKWPHLRGAWTTFAVRATFYCLASFRVRWHWPRQPP